MIAGACVWGNERVPIARLNGMNGAHDEQQHNGQLNENNDVVKTSRLFYPDHQKQRDECDNDDSRQVEQGGRVRQSYRVDSTRLQTFQKLGAYRLPLAAAELNQVGPCGGGKLRW